MFVMAIGNRRGGSKFNMASPRQSSTSQVITAPNIRTNPSIKATILIPDPNELQRFRENLDERQAVRIAAKLPLLDVEAEVMQMIHQFAQAECRDRLRPYLAATLATTKATGGMVATLRRHREAQREARLQLFRAEGQVPPC